MVLRIIGRNPRQFFFIVAGLALASLAAGIIFWRHTSSQAAPTAARPSVPVTVAEATVRDVGIYSHALGTVQALNTVAIRAQVNGQIVSVNFRQGQEVHQGEQDESLREQLAKFLHDHHERTAHSLPDR